MRSEIFSFIDQAEFVQSDMRELAKRSPVQDEELDALIGEAVARSDQQAFVFLAVAALSANRVVSLPMLAPSELT